MSNTEIFLVYGAIAATGWVFFMLGKCITDPDAPDLFAGYRRKR